MMEFVTNAELKSSPSKLKSTTTIPDLGRLYLAGPIRGNPLYKAQFDYATRQLRAVGYQVFNPVEQDAFYRLCGVKPEIRRILESDLAWICRDAEIVAFLHGSDRSLGARAEYATAKACGIQIWDLPPEYQL